jgi:hypothetical protein
MPEVKLSTPQVSNEILAMVNLKLPSLKDVVHFEALSLSRDKAQAAQVQKAHEILENIAVPSRVHTPAQRENIEHLRERLIEESQKGNSTAEAILSASSMFAGELGKINVTLAELKNMLLKTAHPELSSEKERDFYTRLHEFLAREEKENHNELAKKIISITNETTTSDIENIKTQLLKEHETNTVASHVITAINEQSYLRLLKTICLKLVNPMTITSPTEKERFTNLHDLVEQSAKSNNQLAKEVLDVKEETSLKDIEKINKDVHEAWQRKEPVAKGLLSALNSPEVPSDNRLQPLTQKDYTEIEKMWEDNYRTLPVPFGFSEDQQGRIAWIEKDVEDIQQTIDLMQSPELEKKKEGLKKVSTILPFLLLGGFSYQEILDYLAVKQKAANNVLAELKSSEGNKEKVNIEQKKPEEQKTLSAEEENSKNTN